jgi:hypothetical protein
VDRALDVRSRPESETFFESWQAMRPWLVEKDCICRFLPKNLDIFFRLFEKCAEKVVFSDPQ